VQEGIEDTNSQLQMGITKSVFRMRTYCHRESLFSIAKCRAELDGPLPAHYHRPVSHRALLPQPEERSRAMQCPRCQQDNPPQAKFCLECGNRLVLTCAQCSTELPAGAKFCLECGQPVGAGPAGSVPLHGA